ncbi:SIR2 family protein [Thermopolyspora sp. NPDC052614]|uniref:SIR2 family NAD-dependent protein deacylase n=1 Tax=Thermopolyspora sp. NPDC052614 TaxID=3155682 RepID=UPI003418FF28
MRESDWNRLIDVLTRGECTPFLGAGACHPTLPTGRELSETWAELVDYPFENRGVLPEVMDFASVTYGDPIYVKQRVVRMLTERGHPDFADEHEPHALLARFPLPVYLTTNYDDFMVRALRRQRKRPRALSCPWYLNPSEVAQAPEDDNLTPRAKEPVVFHLHGNAADARSLVLTRTDYVEFLVNLTKDYAADDRKLIPTEIRPWLTNYPLLFLGYSLQDWTFSVLFQGLLKTISELQHRRHISVQLPPPGRGIDDQKRAQDYLTRYFDRWNISVYWGTVNGFCQELRRRVGWS